MMNKKSRPTLRALTHAFVWWMQTNWWAKIIPKNLRWANCFCGCKVILSERFGVIDENVWNGTTGQWLYRCPTTGQEGSIKLKMERIGPAVVEFQCPWDGNSRKSPTGQWTCRCTSTGQYGSIEFELEWIGPVVVKLQRPQSPDGMTDGLRLFHNPPYFPSEEDEQRLSGLATPNSSASYEQT